MDEQKKRLYGLVRECRVLKDYYYKLARKAKTQSDVDTYTRWADGHEHDENVLIHVAMVFVANHENVASKEYKICKTNFELSFRKELEGRMAI